MLTAARRNEAAQMRRDEITGTVWTIPASRGKGKADHAKPLWKAAKAIIDAMPLIGDGAFIFTHDGETPLGGFSKFKAALDKESGVENWGLHDLRRTARSLMSRTGVPSDHAERALGHVIGGIRRVYDRHEFLEEKRAAFDALRKMSSGSPARRRTRPRDRPPHTA